MNYMYSKNELFNFKDVHCSSIMFAHRAENLGEASPFVVLSSQGFHCAMEDEHSLMIFSFYLLFASKNRFKVLQQKVFDLL